MLFVPGTSAIKQYRRARLRNNVRMCEHLCTLTAEQPSLPLVVKVTTTRRGRERRLLGSTSYVQRDAKQLFRHVPYKASLVQLRRIPSYRRILFESNAYGSPTSE